jgi:hypothetical protein
MTHFSVIIRDLLDSVLYIRLEPRWLRSCWIHRNFVLSGSVLEVQRLELCSSAWWCVLPWRGRYLRRFLVVVGGICGAIRNISIVNVKFSLNIFFAALNRHFRISIYLSIYLSICLSFYLSLYLSIYLPLYGSTAFCWNLAAFSVSWPFYTVGRTPWTGNQAIYTQNNTNTE